MQTVEKNKQNNCGFTLVELIVVIAIMTIMVGGTIIGISVLASGNARKASNTLNSSLNELRTNTMSMQGGWKAKIYKDKNAYKVDLLKTETNDDGTMTTTVVASEELGSRINIQYIEGVNPGGTTTVVNESNSIYITYVAGSGKFGTITAGDDSSSNSIKGDSTVLAGQFLISSKSGSTEYRLKLWYETGRITTE